MDRELIIKSKEILDRDQLDMEEQQVLNEISIGKLSPTVFLGRLKVLTRKIKDKVLQKTLQRHRDSNLYRIEGEVRGGYGDLAVGLKEFPKFIGYLGEQLANP